MSSSTPSSPSSAWKSEHVVPDVISSAPPAVAEITFRNKSVLQGNELTPSLVNDFPTKLNWEADPKQLYTVVMLDPDAPQRAAPKFRNWLHYLNVNVPGNDLKKGSVLASWIPSCPPSGSLHRYVFLIYQQSAPIALAKDSQINDRKKFSLTTFLQKHDAHAKLVAGNFYQAQYDSHCDKVWETLK